MFNLSISFGIFSLNFIIVIVLIALTYASSFIYMFFEKNWTYTLISLACYTLFSTIAGFYSWDVSKLSSFVGNSTGGIFYYFQSVIPMAAVFMITFSWLLFLCKQRLFAQIISFISTGAVIYITFQLGVL